MPKQCTVSAGCFHRVLPVETRPGFLSPRRRVGQTLLDVAHPAIIAQNGSYPSGLAATGPPIALMTG
ncbi:MAG: hypothetical protein O3A25_15290, partial [Acidobacteria bacterium]|nr:hypothetical protein [Acidobacteriota bacterium]